MNMRDAGHKARPITAAAAAAMVRSGMWLDYGAGLCQPDEFDKALAARRDELHDVKIRGCLSTRPRAVFEEDPEGRHFYGLSLHFSGYDRRKHDAGRIGYMPVNLGEIPDYYRRFIPPVDIVVIRTCRMDKDGFFNFSAANLWHRAILERAKCVIVEVTDGLPYCLGVENGVHVSEVDFIIEGDNQPAPVLPNPPATEVDRAVGRLIAAEIEDGACLQIGIGGMPNAVCTELLHSSARDLGVHTEMMTDGIVELYKAGPDQRRAQADPSGQAGLFLRAGVGRALRHAAPQPRFPCLPVDHTNLPAQHHGERPGGVDQQHDADRPAGAGGVGIGWAAAHQRHGRAVAVRARGLCVGGRQDVHLPVLDL